MNPLLLGYDAGERPVFLEPDECLTHMHTIGASGSGKSKFLESIMREHLRNHTGFCLADPHGTLYDDIVEFCAHHGLDRDIILLNVSKPNLPIVGFNPFRRAPAGDISVQVDRRITATMHAWGVEDTDQTPTLARTLRLIYTVMLEQDLCLPQVQHLIDFNAQEVRGSMIERLGSPLIQKEWRELQVLKPKEWRDETLSAKNRLFKFLTSSALCRFMGLPEHSINLRDVMDTGKILLVNLAQSDYLSQENARAFGALLVNEFFENALRRERDAFGRPPRPYFLYLDEFQNFVSFDIAEMLDQVRKFSLFLNLSHQRFGRLDENITDAVLTNCRIKAVFGGLPVQSARVMAEELFVGDLDSKKIKAAIYQTKFWPKYSRDKVYTRGTAHGSSSGGSESVGRSSTFGATSDQSFGPNDWLGFAPTSRGVGASFSSTTASSSGSSWSDSETCSESEADIPIFVPVPFQELSSVQYYTHDEQLTELTAALKEQFPRHCFIKIHGQKTQPLLVPFVENVRSFRDNAENLEWYQRWQLDRSHALPAAEVDRLIEQREATMLLQTAEARSKTIDIGLADDCRFGDAEPSESGPSQAATGTGTPIWSRTARSGVTSIASGMQSNAGRKSRARTQQR